MVIYFHALVTTRQLVHAGFYAIVESPTLLNLVAFAGTLPGLICNSFAINSAIFLAVHSLSNVSNTGSSPTIILYHFPVGISAIDTPL